MFQKCSGIEKLLDNRVITIFRYVFVSQYRKFLWGTLQCFRKFGVSKNFMQNRGSHDFPSKFFSLTLPKTFVGEPFGVSENLWYQKISCIRGGRGGGYYDSRSENLLSHFTEETSLGTLLCLTKIRISKNFCMRGISRFSVRGDSAIFCRLLYVSQYRNICRRTF